MKITLKIILFYLIICSSCATAIEDEDQYQKNFRIGIALYSSRDFEQADIFFRKSFAFKEHSKTAYFISDSNFELERLVEAKKFAKLALNKLEPALEDDKKKYLKELMSKIDDIAISNYKSLTSTTRYRFMMSHQNQTPLDSLSKQAIREINEKKISEAKELLLKLGIDPVEFDNPFSMPIHDKCDPNYSGVRTPEMISNCLTELYQ
ncbi:hypothetical protein SAMN06297280_3445 [Arsukibacterium tuosuense]|uniref:Uncharacterized protein n=1 Tax=Arsukibacterium tuosuense TaxID=1323745 RepID=A0A285JGU9_9GAMM|nr:hypothetical protein [Arsukibacterium tuosuense]SNY58606.1 hypothetical protein SAMN06297280_3445 [Arsukibacterium tuosuense]